jgi:hypothetical protein
MASCPCQNLPSGGPDKTDHEDELIVVDAITEVTHRCRLCGRKIPVRYIPGDATMGGDPEKLISKGNDGHPILSYAAALNPKKWDPNDPPAGYEGRDPAV